uniref:Uncharacterized protein n=1 Tax=Arion vulgaris TaxID=1028688 RepID=A0A0B7BZI1_9EUPU
MCTEHDLSVAPDRFSEKFRREVDGLKTVVETRQKNHNERPIVFSPAHYEQL